MSTSQIREITGHYEALTQHVPLHPISDEHDYSRAVDVMHELLDAGAAEEHHPLADLVATLGELMGDYEQRQQADSTVGGVATLKFLMQQHNLRQSDLPEVGSQGVVSEILNGKRELNLRQMRAVARRFGTTVAAFT